MSVIAICRNPTCCSWRLESIILIFQEWSMVSMDPWIHGILAYLQSKFFSQRIFFFLILFQYVVFSSHNIGAISLIALAKMAIYSKLIKSMKIICVVFLYVTLMKWSNTNSIRSKRTIQLCFMYSQLQRTMAEIADLPATQEYDASRYIVNCVEHGLRLKSSWLGTDTSQVCFPEHVAWK